MSMNYDASQVGVPYVRAQRVEIFWPDAGKKPHAVINQSLAVKLADGTVRQLENLPALEVVLDFDRATDPIPLVDPDTGLPLGPSTTLQMAMLNVLAVVREKQIAAEVLPE